MGKHVSVAIHELELWIVRILRSSVAISERRTAFCVHGTVSGMLGAFGREGLARKKHMWERKTEVAMKYSEMATGLREVGADMQLFTITHGDWETPDELGSS